LKSFRQFIDEMAQNLGMMSSFLNRSEKRRKAFYEKHKNDTTHEKVSDNLHIHVSDNLGHDRERTVYTTLDHNKKECLHHAEIEHQDRHGDLPFAHGVQVGTERTDAGLPKGHASTVVYNHFLKSDKPLRSDSLQSHGGNKMWHGLVHRAMKDGHHVYHWDGAKLHKTTSDNVEEHLKKYYGHPPEYFSKHMILSKKEIV
jgi:hypothetical protein